MERWLFSTYGLRWGVQVLPHEGIAGRVRSSLCTERASASRACISSGCSQKYNVIYCWWIFAKYVYFLVDFHKNTRVLVDFRKNTCMLWTLRSPLAASPCTRLACARRRRPTRGLRGKASFRRRPSDYAYILLHCIRTVFGGARCSRARARS